MMNSLAHGILLQGFDNQRNTLESVSGNPAWTRATREIFSQHDTIVKTFEDIVPKVTHIMSDKDLTPQARTQRANSLIQSAEEKAASAVDAQNKALDALVTSLHQNAQYPSPAGDPILNETKIQGIKQDLQMRLTNVDTGELPEVMGALLKEYAQEGNSLAVRLLAEDSWPLLYIQSRGKTGQLISQGYKDYISRIVEPFLPETARSAKRLLNQATTGSDSLAAAMLISKHFAPTRAEELRRIQPAY